MPRGASRRGGGLAGSPACHGGGWGGEPGGDVTGDKGVGGKRLLGDGGREAGWPIGFLALLREE